MSKFSNFIINKPFSAINNAARHIFSRYLLENKHLFYQYFKISNTGIDHLEQLINVNFSLLTGRHFVNAIVFHKFFFLHRRRIAFCVEDHKTNNC